MGQKISEKQMKEEIRSVVRENIKEVTTNDWHYKAIMSIWDKGGSFTRKKIGAVLCNDPKADRRDVEDALRNSGYDEVTDVTDRLRIEGVIKEEDSIPGGLAKGMTLNDIAEKHGMSVDMLVAEFKKGIQTEMEHTTDREMAKEITMDHLFEDPQYYTKLATVEEYVDDKGVEHVAAALPQTEEEPIKEGEDSEETLEGLKEMAMGDLERIADYANMILERMGQGQNLDSWMYSQITLAVDQLNSVHDTMDGTDGKKEEIKEEKPGLWANIRAKQARGEKPAHGNSDAHKDAVKAGKEINNEEAVNELTNNERQIKTGNPNNVFYVFYKGQFEAVYWAMNPSDLFKIYWDKFKVRRPAGSKFKLNPEFIIVPKKEYDDSSSNRYAKLKPYVDKFWDKLQNESVNESLIKEDIDTMYLVVALIAQLGALGQLGFNHIGDYKRRLGPIDSIKQWWKDKKDDKAVKSIIAKIKSDPEMIAFFKLSQNQQKGKFRKLIATKLSSDEIQYLNRINKSDLQQNESVGVNEAKEEWAGLDTIKRGGYGSPTLRNGDKVRMVVDARKNKYYNGVINGSSIKWEDGAKSELSLSMQASNRGDLQVLRPTTKNESVNEASEPEIIAQIKNIAKTHQNNIVVDPKSGKKMRVDAFSASAIATVYDALGDSNKEKFLSSGLLGMQQMAMKLLKK
jgi:hypothetical protein